MDGSPTFRSKRAVAELFDAWLCINFAVYSATLQCIVFFQRFIKFVVDTSVIKLMLHCLLLLAFNSDFKDTNINKVKPFL